MILNTRRNSSPALAKARLAWIVTATVLVGVAALQIGPRVVFAEGPAPKPVAEITANTDSPNAPHTVVLSSDAVSPMPVPAGISLVAQADAPGVEPGPKFKPDAPREEPSAAVVPEAPDGPSIDAVPPSPPHVARMSKPGKTPRPPGDPDTDNERDGSIEERVRRLEKMVHALAEQQKIKHAHGDIYFKDGADQEYGMAKQTYMIDQQELDRIKGSAERQAARAAEQAKRATKDFQARILQEQQGQGEFREAFQRQLEALRKAREGLGQEMERLNRQIEKLEKEQQRSDKDGGKDQRRSDGPTEKLQAQAAPTPELK